VFVPGVPLDAASAPAAAGLIARAFQDDPEWVYSIPDDGRRRRVLPRLFLPSLRLGATSGHLFGTAGELRGVAQWIPPESQKLPPLAVLRSGMLGVPLVAGRSLPRIARILAASARFRSETAPKRHLFLAGIAVEPEAQGTGVGTELLRAGLRMADRDRMPCFLLTSNPRNLPFYERQGFEVVSSRRLHDDGPESWALLRTPQ
jgi:ribosomal protein S18 acetylase RimI-like enzyme